MKPLIVFALGFAVRAAIVAANPIIWGGDSVLRLFDRFTLVKSHQLPLLQILIAGVSAISMDPLLVQLLMALVGAAAGLGFYWMAADLYGEEMAFLAALLFVTHPFILAVSTVPFQEILMLAGLLFAFHFFFVERWWLASLCLAAACLTRHEAWLACPVFAVAYFWMKDRTVRGALVAAALFGWMPVAWMMMRGGLSPAGHFVIEPPQSWRRLLRYVYIGWISVKFTQLPVVVLSVCGGWHLFRNWRRLDWRWWMAISFVCLFLGALPFSAHGVMPDPERYVTSREAHLPMFAMLLLAGFGLMLWPRWRRVLVGVSVVLGLAQALWYVRVQSSDSSTQVDYRLAQYLDRSVQRGERVLLLVPPSDREATGLFLEKARETGGEEGLRRAREELREVEATPFEFQRVVVYSRLGRDRFLKPPAPCGEWVAIWSRYPEAEGELAGARPVEVIRSGAEVVRVLRRDCGVVVDP
ncbi:MAG: hypothetical protein ABI693_01615 [Bryobacteraceae bacterium]